MGAEDMPRLTRPPASDVTWSAAELELNYMAQVHAERLRQVHEAGGQLVDRVREAVTGDGLDAERVAEVTGLDVTIVREMARPPGTAGGRFTRLEP